MCRFLGQSAYAVTYLSWYPSEYFERYGGGGSLRDEYGRFCFYWQYRRL